MSTPPSTHQEPGTDDAEVRDEVAGAEEFMVPPLPVRRYLSKGLAMVRLTPAVHLLRLMGSVFSWGALFLPLSLIYVAYNTRPFDTLTSTDQTAAETALESGGIISLDSLPIVAVLGPLIVVLALGVQGALDAVVFGSLRDASGGDARDRRRWLRRAQPGHMIVAFTQLAMATGGALFMAPLLIQVARSTNQNHDSDGQLALAYLVVAFAVVAVGATFRLASRVIAAFVVWRPDFVAGALLSGAAFIVRGRRAALWLWSIYVTALAGVAVAVNGVALAGVQPETVAVVAGFGIVFCVVLEHILDGVLVAFVGHRIGSVPRIVFDPRMLSSSRDIASTILEYAPPGAFRAAPKLEAGGVPFARLIGREPNPRGRNAWTTHGLLEGHIYIGELSRGLSGDELDFVRPEHLATIRCSNGSTRRS